MSGKLVQPRADRRVAALGKGAIDARIRSGRLRRRLPAPEVNAGVEGYTADFVWREARLIVETDGWVAQRIAGALRA